MNFSSSVNLRATETSTSCIDVQWQKKDAGLCNVNYTVKFKHECNEILHEETGINIARKIVCDIPHNISITRVELIISSTNRRKIYIAGIRPRTAKQGRLSSISFEYLNNLSYH